MEKFPEGVGIIIGLLAGPLFIVFGMLLEKFLDQKIVKYPFILVGVGVKWLLRKDKAPFSDTMLEKHNDELGATIVFWGIFTIGLIWVTVDLLLTIYR